MNTRIRPIHTLRAVALALVMLGGLGIGARPASAAGGPVMSYGPYFWHPPVTVAHQPPPMRRPGPLPARWGVRP